MVSGGLGIMLEGCGLKEDNIRKLLRGEAKELL